MSFTTDESKILKTLVQNELDLFKKEGKTITLADYPGFPAAEEKYEEFLEKLLKKL